MDLQTEIILDSFDKRFDVERWVRLKNKLNIRTQEVIEEVFAEINSQLEAKGMKTGFNGENEGDRLIDAFFIGFKVKAYAATKHTNDFKKLKKALHSQLRWFFTHITITQIDDNWIHLNVRNEHLWNFKLVSGINTLYKTNYD
jgi:hypothetical protein